MPPRSLNDYPDGNVLRLPVEISQQPSVLPLPNFHQQIDGVSYDAFRSRIPYLSQDRINGAAHIPVSSDLPSASWFTTPARMASATPTAGYDQALYQNPDFGVHGRKTNKATQACNQCRVKKPKCDEGQPSCSRCRKNNLDCAYKEMPPPGQERTTQMLLDRLAQIEDRMEDRFATSQQMQEQILKQMPAYLSKMPNQQPTQTAQECPILPPPPPSPPPLAIKQDPPLKTEMPQTPNVFDPGSQDILEPMDPRVDNQESEAELSIPVDHSTAAHKLLRWPSIKRLLHPAEYDEDYVMQLEEERGLISIYGHTMGVQPSLFVRFCQIKE